MLSQVTATDDSAKDDSEYFVPIKDKTKITEDTLTLAFEGTSLKPKLPDIRMGSKVPFHFVILDYDVSTTGTFMRSLNEVQLTWGDDPNSCTLPAECVDPDAEDGAYTASAVAAISLTLATSALF